MQSKIEKALQYDEYRYRQENNILLKNKNRALGLHKVFYQCIKCKSLYSINSKADSIFCESCGTSWKLSENGWLIENNSNKKIHLPDWYEWQRKEVTNHLEKIQETYDVNVQALPNEFGFVQMGDGQLILNEKEFVLKIQNDELHFPHKIRESVQTEYNYKNQGMCIVLSTLDCCYYIYSKDKNFNPTRLKFIDEYFFNKNKIK